MPCDTENSGDLLVRRVPLKQILVILLGAVVFLAPIQNAQAAVPVTSGTVQLSNTLSVGDTAYSVDYSYPSIARVGSNLTVALTLHVDSLTGLVEYLFNYGLVVDVSIGQNEFNGSIYSGNGAAFLYPGATWGPNNVTVPLTEENTGLSPGTSANASVAIMLVDTLWWGGQLAIFHTEPAMQGSAGSLLIQNPAQTTKSSTTVQRAGQGNTYLPYGLLALGAVLLLSGVVVSLTSPKPGPRESRTASKSTPRSLVMRSKSNSGD
jgi:hypothetical protein